MPFFSGLSIVVHSCLCIVFLSCDFSQEANGQIVKFQCLMQCIREKKLPLSVSCTCQWCNNKWVQERTRGTDSVASP